MSVSGPQEVCVYFEGELAFKLPVCYNDYMEAEQAVKEYIMERLSE